MIVANTAAMQFTEQQWICECTKQSNALCVPVGTVYGDLGAAQMRDQVEIVGIHYNNFFYVSNDSRIRLRNE